MSFEKISVIGLGYIGLPTAAMFAKNKIKVIGVDVNQSAVNIINQGGVHIVEPGLDKIVGDAVKNGYLTATTTPEPADAFLIAVPTPFLPHRNEELPKPDLTYIKEASKAIASVIKKGDLVILESTSPVGATEKVANWIAEYRQDLTFPQTHGEVADVNIAHCPERVLPGNIVHELTENDRVIGGLTPKCSRRAIELYKTFVNGECVATNARTAEMTKLTENSFRDVQIAFANELSVICDELDINVWELINLANRHPRVNILNPGPGVGGHCIAVDPWFIVYNTPDVAQLIHTARKVNDSKPFWVLSKIKNAIKKCLDNNPNRSVNGIKIHCFGLSFKPNIDDLRESPALKIVRDLVSFHPGKVYAVEPNINEIPQEISDVELVNFDGGIYDSDISVILVNHNEFETLSFPSETIVIDATGVLESKY